MDIKQLRCSCPQVLGCWDKSLGGTTLGTLLIFLTECELVELLAAEIPDVKFVIVGPGWVKTKIHNSILNARDRAGPNYERTLEKLRRDEFTPMEKVVECCNILINGSKDLLTGRNFSVVFDNWGSSELDVLLVKYPDMYKLRRFGNDF